MNNVKDPVAVLKSVFGYDSFRGPQEEIVTHVSRGNSAFVLMQTGGGKSLCFQVPGLARGGLTLVISPLISLMKDQVDALKKKGVNASYISSSQENSEKRAILKDLMSGKTEFLYVSPERLEMESFQQIMKSSNLSLIAVDEAHCVSQWGHDFREAYQNIGGFLEKFSAVPVIALTATADKVTQDDICASLGLTQSRRFAGSFDRPNIDISVTPSAKPIESAAAYLKTHGQNGASIVFRSSRKDVERTALDLIDYGFNAVGYHAGMSAKEREEIQDRFLDEKDIIVVATIAFGMGIDRADVRNVIHLDPPSTLEGYYQEIGRAGRDGEPSKAAMFYDDKSLAKLRQRLEMNEDISDERKISLRLKLERILSFVLTPGCRRKTLLAYFDEHLEEDCGKCDGCRRRSELKDGYQEARILCEAILGTEEKYGVSTLASILAPASGRGVSDPEKRKLTAYGRGAYLSQNQWKTIARQMLGAGYLDLDPERMGAIRLTKKGRSLIFHEQEVLLAKTWIEIIPDEAPVRAGRAFTEGQRDKLPEKYRKAYDDLVELFRPDLLDGALRPQDLMRIVEARPADKLSLTKCCTSPVVLSRAEEVVEAFYKHAEPEEDIGGFSIDL